MPWPLGLKITGSRVCLIKLYSIIMTRFTRSIIATTKRVPTRTSFCRDVNTILLTFCICEVKFCPSSEATFVLGYSYNSYFCHLLSKNNRNFCSSSNQGNIFFSVRYLARFVLELRVTFSYLAFCCESDTRESQGAKVYKLSFSYL